MGRSSRARAEVGAGAGAGAGAEAGAEAGVRATQIGVKKLTKSLKTTFLANSILHTKFDPIRMKNIEVKEIRYWSALFGPSSRSKNSRSHFKLILCSF